MSVTVVNGASAPVTTYSDGTGNPNQGSLVYATSAATWWYFQINSANDVVGNPGTHKVSAWYNQGGDPGVGNWTYYGDSPNFATTAHSASALLTNGRSLGCLYWNNSGGSNKDILHSVVTCYPPASSANTGGAIGNLRSVLTGNSVTWGNWGYWFPNDLPVMPAGAITSPVLGRGTDGFISSVCGLWANEDMDAAAICSTEADTSDTWTAGGTGTGNTSAGSAVVTNLSNETGMTVGYGITADLTSALPQKINSIDSGTQVTASATMPGASTGGSIGWTNFSPGTRTTNLIIDSSMVHETNASAVVALASGAMLSAYDDGALLPPNFQELHYRKGSGTHAAGLWPANNGAGDGSVFGSNSSQVLNDWCLCSISTTAVYCVRRTAATTCEVRNYVTASNTWQAITNAPPTMTGKTIVSGGGVCLVSDGTDMWLLVIDSTDGQVKYAKYTHGGTNINGTWGSWTNLAATAATAAFLTAAVGNGYVAVTWTEKNANNTNYDTKSASLSIGTHAVVLSKGWENWDGPALPAERNQNRQLVPRQ